MVLVRVLRKGAGLLKSGELGLGAETKLKDPPVTVTLALSETALRSEPLVERDHKTIADALVRFLRAILAETGGDVDRLLDEGFEREENTRASRGLRLLRCISWPESRLLVRFFMSTTVELTHLSAANWKSFVDMTIELSRISLLIGPNNAGKTNILELPSLANQLIHSPTSVFARREEVRIKEQPCRLGIRFTRNDVPGSYDIAWNEHGILEETLHVGHFAMIRSERELELMTSDKLAKHPVKPQVSYLRWFASLGGEIGESTATERALARELMSVIANYRVWSSVPVQIARPWPVLKVPQLGPDGSHSAALLDYLRDSSPDRYDAIQRDLRTYAPEVSRVTPQATASEGTKEIRIYERDGSSFPLNHASEGTQLLLYFLLIAHGPQAPAVMGLEDVEHGLHPRRIKDIIDIVRGLAERPDGPQILCSTHSPIVLDYFKDSMDDVVVVERSSEHGTRCVPLHNRFSELAQSTQTELRSLGDLWYSGVLGGVPE